MTRLLLAVLVLAAPLHAAAQPKPMALPQGGSAPFSPSGQPLTVTTTPNSVIRWQSFTVQPGELTRFNPQPPSPAVLNRVQGTAPAAQIQGVLQQPGKVQLVSPAGQALPPAAGVSVSVFGTQSQTVPFSLMRSATEAVRTPEGKIVFRATAQ